MDMVKSGATLADLMRLLAFAKRELPRLDKYEAITGINYDHPRFLEAWRGVANFDWLIQDDGSIDFNAAPPETPNGGHLDYFQAFQLLKNITCAKHSFLGNATVANIYKTALAAFNDDNLPIPGMYRGMLRNAMVDIRNSNRPAGKKETLVGSASDFNTWIYSEGDGPYIREIHVQSGKNFGFPVEIDVFADAHFNWFNQKDLDEANPALMSTRQGRMWLKDGESVPLIRKIMDYCQWADQTICLGDLLDFMSEGARQLTVEQVFARDAHLLACFGNHETTRVMQGTVPDPVPLEDNRKHVASFWCNDHIIASKMVGNRVFVEVMDNSMNAFLSEQYEKLAADIKMCRSAGRVMLLFMHNPICTNDERFSALAPIWQNDPGVKDFNQVYPGAQGCDEATRRVYDLIVSNADVIRGIFAGHLHSDYYMEVTAGYSDCSGNFYRKNIPQVVITGGVYDQRGHLLQIIVD